MNLEMGLHEPFFVGLFFRFFWFFFLLLGVSGSLACPPLFFQSPLQSPSVKMRSTHLFVLALLAVSIGSSLAIVRMPLARSDVPVANAGKYRRYLSDPMGFAVSLYSGLLNIGGQNYRLILVRSPVVHLEGHAYSLLCRLDPFCSATPKPSLWPLSSL